MWIYEQRSGKLRRNDTLVTTGYSGFSAGKNDPLAQHQVGIGPIPQGAYWIGDPFDSPSHGPHVMRLISVNGTQTFGRNGFLIHGDSQEAPGTASHGCIVVGRKVREAISDSRDSLLVVLSGNFLEVA